MYIDKEKILLENGFTKRNDVELHEYEIYSNCFYRKIGNCELYMNYKYYNPDILYIKIRDNVYAQGVDIKTINEENLNKIVNKALQNDYNYMNI